MDGVQAELGEGLQHVGAKGVGERGECGEGEGSEDVCRKDGGPETEGLLEVFLFGEDQGDGVERVFGEELGAAEDGHDEAEGIKHLCDEESDVRRSRAGGSEQRDSDGVSQCREAHEDAAGGRRWRGETLERPSS